MVRGQREVGPASGRGGEKQKEDHADVAAGRREGMSEMSALCSACKHTSTLTRVCQCVNRRS